MLISVKAVADDSCWMIDTGLMRWARTDGDSDKSEILEFGKLIFVGMQGVLRIFAFEGRTVSTEGPGAGLCTFGYAMIDLDTTLTFYIQANVPIKDIVSRRTIETVRYELIPVPGADNGTQEEREGPSGQEEPTEPGSVPEATTGTEPTASEADIQSHD